MATEANIKNLIINKVESAAVFDVIPKSENEIYLIQNGDSTEGLHFVSKQYVDAMTQSVLQAVYPIGAIYISTADVDPAVLFGFGEWERIKDTFLLASGECYANGSTGGETTHTLTADEMPSHSHNFEVMDGGTAKPSIPQWPESINPADRDDWWHITWKREGTLPDDFYPYTNWLSDISSTGGGREHNNMPPYLAVCMFKRIA